VLWRQNRSMFHSHMPWGRKRLLVGLLASAVAGLVAGWGARTMNSGERFPLEFRQGAIDMGSLPLARTGPVEFRFDFVNRCEDDVEIDSVTAGCGCLNASAEPKVIPPGGHGTIVAYLEPSLGVLDKGVRVRLKGYSRSKTLHLKATFSNGILADETIVDLGHAKQGARLERSIGLHVAPWYKSPIVKIESQRGLVRANLTDVAGSGKRVRIWVPDNATRGMSGGFSDAVSFYGEGPESPQLLLTLGVAGWVESRVEFVPQNAFFGFGGLGSAAMDVDVRGKEHFEVVALRTTDSRIRARLRYVSDTTAVLHVELTSQTPAIVTGHVEIELDGNEIYKLPVAGRFIAGNDRGAER